MGADLGLSQMTGAKDVWWCRDHSPGPSVTGCLTLGLEKIRVHHRQNIGWSTGEETSLSTVVPTHRAFGSRQQRQSQRSPGLHGTCWLLRSVVVCLEPQVAPRPESFRAFEKAYGSAHGTGKKRGMEGQESYKIPFVSMVGGRIFPAAPIDTEMSQRDDVEGLKMERKRLKRNSQGN